MSAIAANAIGAQTRAASRRPRNYRAQMTLLMLGADLLAMAGSGGLVFLLNLQWHFFVFDAADLKYALVPLLCLVLFMSSRLYPGVGISPVEEIKLVTRFVTRGVGAGLLLLIVIQSGWKPNHMAFVLTWAMAVLLVLLTRWSVRIVASKMGWWGEPVVVIGRGGHIDRTVTYFWDRRRLGFVPVLAAVDTSRAGLTHSIPIIDYRALLESPPDRFASQGIHTALVDAPGISEFFRSDESKALFQHFQRLILVSDLDWIEGASMQIQDFEGLIGIAAQKSVLSPANALAKRALDIVGSLVLGALSLPMMLAVSLWIKLDSRGQVFYHQRRVGKDGQVIRIHKFRTMCVDADHSLQAYLQVNTGARREWQASRKLSNDPRITPAGRFLRKFSIDETPQFLNVLKGELSLVGPRPIVEDEMHHYGENIEIYKNMRPGVTGLWQVSGRSKTSYEERVRYDTYYVRNWSVWLDLYVLLRTVWVVLRREGAY